MSLSRELAKRVVALDPARFDPEAVKWARNAIADMIGCTLLGAPTETTSAPPPISMARRESDCGF